MDQAAENHRLDLLLVTSPYAVAVAISSTGCLYVFDSHSYRTNIGALVAVPSSTATSGNRAACLFWFLIKKFGLGLSLILDDGRAMNRKFQFVFLEKSVNSSSGSLLYTVSI